MKLPWNDLQIVLSIARAGSLAGASRQLGVSHATVFRRLNEIEQRLGVKLFDRSRTGYRPTVAGEDIAAAAGRVEAEVLDVERRIVGTDLRPSGTVRVTTTDSLLVGLLSPIFAEFRAVHPDIKLEVAISNQLFDLSRREADVAIRPTLRPPELLVGRKIGVIHHAVYGRLDPCSPSPRVSDSGTHEWIGPDEGWAYSALEQWMTAKGLSERCCYRVDAVLGMHAAVCAGVGLAALPCYLCDDDRRVVRVGNCIPELSTELWLLTHPDLRRTVRIRTFADFVSREVAKKLNDQRKR